MNPQDFMPFILDALVGGLFRLLGQQSIAPPTIPAVFGVVGLTVGYLIVAHFR